MKPEIMKFTDLMTQLSPTDVSRRKLIDNASLEQAVNVSEFTQIWDKLSLQVDDNTVFTGTVGNLPSTVGEKFLCRMHVWYQEKQGLDLSFAVREAPPQAGHRSLVALYNTKVAVRKISGFQPFTYYDSVMYLIRQVVPNQTKLCLYVRQRDSRQLLDAGGDPRKIPLTQVFVKAGWEYGRYTFRKQEVDPLKRHRLVLYSGKKSIE